jgi:hypothetical protein
MSVDTKNLTPAKRWLVHRMHQTIHGTMHNLIVHDGEPVIDPPPKIKQAVKLGGKRSKPKAVPPDFVLKEQHVELFDLMEDKQNGVIEKLIIQDGLPFLAELEFE